MSMSIMISIILYLMGLDERNETYVVWAYGVVVSMFGFHRSDRGLNPSCGGKIS